MSKILRFLFRVLEWSCIFLFLAVVYLCVSSLHIPRSVCETVLRQLTGPNLVVRCGGVHVGLRTGIEVQDVAVYDLTSSNANAAVVSVESLALSLIHHTITVRALRYPRLPDSYYAPGNLEKNARVDVTFLKLPELKFVLEHPDILAITPDRVEGYLRMESDRIDFANIQLDWPKADGGQRLHGFCTVDIGEQCVTGSVWGAEIQSHIRPMIVALDVPVALPYMDGFTEVPRDVDARCDWLVNLVNNDFDLWLDLKPDLGKYNGVPMRHADGTVHLHNRIRGTWLNYHQEIVVTNAVSVRDEALSGRIDIYGHNGTNRVVVSAVSDLPVAHLLKIGGFTGDYVGDDVIGHSTGDIEFRFPRAMTNNYEVLNGRGHVAIRDGKVMRMKGFKGLIEAMPSIAPGVSWFSDSCQASCDYVIENGVLRSDNIVIDSYLYSIKMYGSLDTVRQKLDFTVRLQFAKSDTIVGQILQPLTLPFTKLVLEFHLGGSPEHPEWKYISIVDRVKEIMP